MSRLTKNANNVSPEMHKEVDRHVVDGNNERSKVQQAQMEFVIAKRLLASLPIVPTNERVYELAQDIHAGAFEDLGDISNCEQNWDEWVKRCRELLQAKGILVLSRLKKKQVVATQNKLPAWVDDMGIMDPAVIDVDGKPVVFDRANQGSYPYYLENGKSVRCKDCGEQPGIQSVWYDEAEAICPGCSKKTYYKLSK